MKVTRQHIQNFYDSFSYSMVQSNRLSIGGNKRVEKVKDTLRRFVRASDVVLEIGCGIGVLSEFMIKKCGVKKVIGIDISGNNINYARATVRCKNIDFIQADILEKGKIAEIIKDNEPVNCVLMADVIEHIPVENHKMLFQSLMPYLTNEARLILTYTSYIYTEYLKIHKPDLLQPVDEVISWDKLHDIESYVSGIVIYYELHDIWKKKDFAHVVLEHNPDLLSDVRMRKEKSLLSEVLSSLREYFLRKKYVHKPLKKIQAVKEFKGHKGNDLINNS